MPGGGKLRLDFLAAVFLLIQIGLTIWGNVIILEDQGFLFAGGINTSTLFPARLLLKAKYAGC